MQLLPPSRRRHRLAVGVLAAVAAAVVLLGVAGPAGAADDDRARPIFVVQIDGLLDPPNATLLTDSIRQAERDDAQLLVVKVASGGVLDVDVQPLVRAMRTSEVPVAVWVGPSGAKAKGGAALVAQAAGVLGVSNGASLGPADPVRLDDPDDPSAVAGIGALAEANGRKAAGARASVDRRLSPRQAVELGASDRVCPNVPGCPTLGDFIVGLDGRTVETAGGPVELTTAQVIGEGEARRRQVSTVVQFRKLDLVGQAVHTLTSPSIAYLLLVVGFALIVFEFFTISIGLAGGTGAVALVGAFVGFSHLPVTWWGVALVMLAMFGFAVDVQAGRPYAWTVIGAGALVAGSLTLYGGSSRLDVPWWMLVVVIGATLVFMVAAMPVAVRSRFSTPTIGREALVGELGDAVVDVAPDGVVLVRGARWRARTNRATPVKAGERVRVVEVDGLVLEIEPEAGGARDYRERRAKQQ